METNETVVIYARVATRQQADANSSVAGQIGQCRDWAEAKRQTVAGVHHDAPMSGNSRLTERSGLTAAIDALTPGSGLLVASVDRLSRNSSELVTILGKVTERGCYVVAVDGGIDTSSRNDSYLSELLQLIR